MNTNHRVLIIEDDKFLSNAYRIKLKKEGFDVYQAFDGEEGIKMLDISKPEIIILDLILPVKDGFSVLESIKKKDVWKSIPVIVASNLSQRKDLDKAMSMGADDYIVKSDICLKDIADKINRLLIRPKMM